MTKQQLTKIFNKALEIEATQERIQKGLDIISKEIFDGQYEPFLSPGLIHYYIEGIAEYDEQLAEDIEYYLYEARDMKSCTIEHNGKKYKGNVLKEYIDFIH